MSLDRVILRTYRSHSLINQQLKQFHREPAKWTSAEQPSVKALSQTRKQHPRKYLSRMRFARDLEIPDTTCKSHRLFLLYNILYGAHPGAYHYMPTGLRALEKLIKVIDEELQSIGAQKMAMPTMMPGSLWKQTGRWHSTELFKLYDRLSKDYCLGPTHEESITKLVSESTNLAKRSLPIMVYQITRKFRDEMSPKFGLLRGREFEMKDMYTFDTNIETATETYDLVCESYSRIFERLGLDYVKVEGATGNIGGIMSHEYHLPAETGEDSLHICDNCGFQTNSELIETGLLQRARKPATCPECKQGMRRTAGIEVGHTFLLGTKYSKVFGAAYRDEEGRHICQMGCYGLGVSRILQAGVEVLSTETDMRWPSLIAPYQICIIPQQKGHAYEKTFEAAETLSDVLNEVPSLKNEVTINDRTELSIGRRVTYAKQEGYPYLIAVGKKALESPPLFEVIDTVRDTTEYLTLEQVRDKLSSLETIQV